MAAFSSKQKLSHRRLAALNFLSNISLDGHHVDGNKVNKEIASEENVEKQAAVSTQNTVSTGYNKELVNFSDGFAAKR